MTDIRKVATSLTPLRASGSLSTQLRNEYPVQCSDKPVMYDKNGFLNLSLPIVRSPCNHIVNVDLNDARSHCFEAISSGTYFEADVTLDPSVVTPQKTRLVLDSGTPADVIWTIPTLTNLANYLRTAFPDCYQPGFSWTVKFSNNSVHDLTISVPAPAVGQAVTRYCFSSGGTTHVIPTKTSCEFTIVIVSTIPGSESFSFYID